MSLFKKLFSARVWFVYVMALAAALFITLAAFRPVDVPVVLYKLLLASLSGLVMYGLDRALWPYANPASYLESDWRKCPDSDGGDGRNSRPDHPVLKGCAREFCMAQTRQAAMVIGGMLAVCLGL